MKATRKILDWIMEHFSEEIRAIHELRIWPEEFDALLAREKHHEVRRADRDFRAGDWLLLREWDPGVEAYTGRQMFREISHITPPGAWGLPAPAEGSPGVCVLAVR